MPASVAFGLKSHPLGQRLLEALPVLRLGNRQVHHHLFDAPAVGRHLELELGLRQPQRFAVDPGLGHLEMGD